MRKGQSMGINVVVVAVLALLVLVIIILITTGKLGDFNKKANSCSTAGGRCDSNGCGENEFVSPQGRCSGEYEECCVSIG